MQFVGRRLLWLARSTRLPLHSRTILSDAYSCNEAWQKRLNDRVLQRVDPYEFVVEILKRFQSQKNVSAVDVDVVCNCVTSEQQIEELKDIVYKFRHSRDTASTLPSTHHAVTRLCLQFDHGRMLMDLIADPINYGIFPDPFAANMALDKFLEASSFGNAAKLSSFMMLQEEFSNRLLCWMSTYSCLKWLKKPVDKTEPAPIAAETQADQKRVDDDEVIFKIPFLKNPSFDDHFDIADMKQLVGKTLLWMSTKLPPLPTTLSARLIGASLYGKYEEALPMLRAVADQPDLSLYLDVFTAYSGPEVQGKLDKEKSEVAEKEPAEMQIDETKQEKSESANDACAAAPKDNAELKCKEILKNLQSVNRVIDGDLTADFLADMKQELPSLEEADKEQLLQLYRNWSDIREKKVQSQVRRMLMREKLKYMEERRKQLQEEEEFLFFFENRAKWEKMVHPDYETKHAALHTDSAELPSDEAYVIPEVKKRFVGVVKRKRF